MLAALSRRQVRFGTKVRKALALPFYGLAWIFGMVAVIMMAVGVVISGEDIPL
jgi:hypothetical protein